MRFRGLERTIDAVRPEIVHVVNEPWALIVGQALARSRTRVVTHGAENLWDQGSRVERSIRKVIGRRNLPRTHGFVSWNREGVEWARRWGLRAECPSAVISAELPRLERFAEASVHRGAARSSYGIDGSFTLGYVGRLVEEKGINWLLEAWSSSELPADARLVFVGNGALEERVREAARADDRIRLIGPVPFADVPAVMSALDALVLPSLTTRDWCEQYGRVITEAMASGVAVIASDSGAIPQVVGDAGVVVPERSVVGLADAIRRFALEPLRRRHFAAAGLERASVEFAPEVKAQELRSFWAKVMETTPNG
jgi:glycosyltransferase involved in cell wall biosynthesis